jgi:hypothetical protein
MSDCPNCAANLRAWLQHQSRMRMFESDHAAFNVHMRNCPNSDLAARAEAAERERDELKARLECKWEACGACAKCYESVAAERDAALADAAAMREALERAADIAEDGGFPDKVAAKIRALSSTAGTDYAARAWNEAVEACALAVRDAELVGQVEMSPALYARLRALKKPEAP